MMAIIFDVGLYNLIFETCCTFDHFVENNKKNKMK